MRTWEKNSMLSYRRRGANSHAMTATAWASDRHAGCSRETKSESQSATKNDW